MLSGCAGLPTGEPINTTPINDQAYITWIRIDDQFDLQKECQKLGLSAGIGYEIVGCAVFNLKKHTCTIFAANPQTLNDEKTTILGHEALHCFDGSFHKEQ